jgi:hypothetical protein
MYCSILPLTHPTQFAPLLSYSFLPHRPAGVNITAIALGSSHTCALVNGGGLKCWGSADYSELLVRRDDLLPSNVFLGSGVEIYHSRQSVTGQTSRVSYVVIQYMHSYTCTFYILIRMMHTHASDTESIIANIFTHKSVLKYMYV